MDTHASTFGVDIGLWLIVKHTFIGNACAMVLVLHMQ